MHSDLKYLLLLPAAAVIASCASIGNPSGGSRDEDPPRFVRASPAPGTTDFHGNKIDIYFNELINVKDALSKVVVSPPSAQSPRVSSLGRRVSVEFQDTLLPNTTYTIDFGNAIEDNNEQNKLPNFSYTFSTGHAVDSLRISGMVLSADRLEPLQGKLVGIHRNLEDSAFRRLRFDRIARTDDRGRFSIMGVAPGTYRVFALDDNDADMRYSSPEEEIAFYDVTVSPSSYYTTVTDTIFNLKTGAVDTILNRQRSVFLPNNILLRSFKSAFKQQYLSKYERIDTTRLSFLFNSPAIDAPSFSVVGAPRLSDWYIKESSPTNDSITLWIKPRSLVSADTLRISTTFLRTDSTMQLSPFTDTLRFTFNRKMHERAAEKELKERLKKLKTAKDSAEFFQTPHINLQMLTSSVQEVNLPLLFETGTPLASIDTTGFHLDVKKDSVWTPIPFPGLANTDSLQPRKFKIDYPWKFDTEYRLSIDTLAITGIYGLTAKPLTHEFKTRSENDYSTLKLHLTGLDPHIPAFVEVLSGDNPVRRQVVVDNTVVFKYLQPGKYYLRLYEDFNGNGVYDPGDYDAGLQPDLVYYYPKQISLKKNWDKEQDWDVFATAIDLQKPESIKKNKPEADKRASLNSPAISEEEEEEEE